MYIGHESGVLLGGGGRGGEGKEKGKGKGERKGKEGHGLLFPSGRAST
jgi:hypothetical protein